MASVPQTSNVLKMLEDLKADLESKLAGNAQECLAKKKASDDQRSGLKANIDAAERKIAQLEKLVAESDGTSDIVIESDWLVHGVGDVVPLCIVECPDCDNAVIENLEKANLEKRVSESTEELAQNGDAIEARKIDIEKLTASLQNTTADKVAKDKELQTATELYDAAVKEVAEIDQNLANATETRSAEKEANTTRLTDLEQDISDLKSDIESRAAKIADLEAVIVDSKACENFWQTVGGNPRINIEDAQAAGDDLCANYGLQFQQWDADQEFDETAVADMEKELDEVKEAESVAEKVYDEFVINSNQAKEQKTSEAETHAADKDKFQNESDDILEKMADLASHTEKAQAELDAEIALRQEIKDLIASLEKRISNIMSDCDECGTWRIILQGSDETSEGPDCLLGWEYSEDGDILIDEERLANNIKFITLYHKPENLLIDKRGDVWADGTKIARVALTGLVGEFFDNFDDPRLARLMIKPRFIGDNRILHVMQEGFHVICENPNSLRDELARHNLLPYHVGTYFRKRAKECDDHETHDELEELCKVECCGPPELPDCFDIGDCPVTVPQWFKDWYAAHSENLYLKLPYDKRFEGDPLRYSREEQIKFSDAVVDLVIRYFNSTPMQVQSGFDDWFVDRGMKRILNILPLIKKDNPPRGRFNFAGWTFGTNSNSPELLLPLEIDSSTGEIIECVECCDLMDSSCALMLSFDDCCEFACGRWSQDCSYEEGDIVIGKSGEACYEAMVDICAGDCNPEPGKAAETIWRKCTIDCEQDAPVCDFVLSDQFICADESCEAEVAVAARYALNQEQCEYHWTLTAINVYGAAPDVSVESFGHAPGEFYDENNNIIVVNVPLLPVGCDDDDTTSSNTQTQNNPNTWIFRLDARATESNEILSTCFSPEKELELDCGFSVELWDGLDEIRAAAYNWCDEVGGDNPNGKRQGAPETEIGQKVVEMESQYEILLSHIDNPDARSTQSDYYQITTAQTKVANVVSLLSTEYAVNTSSLEAVLENITTAVDANDFDNALKFVHDAVIMTVATISDNQIYVGVEDCCCIIVKPDENDQAVCDLSWVWLVRSDSGFFVPYYGGVGKQAATSVLCVERNPDEYNTTHAEIRLVSYAASCDDIVKARIEGWNGMSSWDDTSDGFEASPVCQCYRTQSITCPCTPREGVANVIPTQCDDQDATKYYIDLSHNNPFNECNVDWIWQLEDNTLGDSPTEYPAGQGVVADDKVGIETASGHNYTIKLRWMSVDGMTGGVVFEQSYTTPVCPRLDLTFDFNFTETQYGEITSAIVESVNEMLPDNYVGDATDGVGVDGDGGPFNTYEVDGEQTGMNLFINTGDSNPYGTFKIAATHNPDLNDPHWQAVDKNGYLWKWIVRILDGDTVVAVLESAERTSENGKAPDLISEDLNADQISHTSSSYTYKVELVAIRDSVHEETNEVEKLNNLHKGARTINSIAPVASDAYYNITLDGRAYNRTIEYRPQINFHGTEAESYTLTYSYANGDQGTQTEAFTVNVIPDPCVLSNATAVSAEPINLPATIPAGETELLQEFRITTEFDLNDECGELSNPDTIFNFMTVYVSGTNNIDVVFNEETRVVNGTGNNAKLEVVGTVTVPFDLTNLTDCSGGYDESPSYSLVDSNYSGQANTMAVASVQLSFGGSVTTSDHPDGGNLDPQQDGVTNHYLTLPYCRCWDGSLVLRGSGVCPDKYGCMNPRATNFDNEATIDDGSCIILGCTDPDALNYDGEATQDDGSCCFVPSVIEDQNAIAGTFEENSDIEGFVAVTNYIQGWKTTVDQLFDTHYDGEITLPVTGVKIGSGTLQIPDSIVQNYNDGSNIPEDEGNFGWRSWLSATDLFDESTIVALPDVDGEPHPDNTVYTREHFIWNGTKYVSLNEPYEQNSETSFEFGWHSAYSDMALRLKGVVSGNDYKIYPSLADSYRPSEDNFTRFAMIVTAQNPCGGGVVRTAVWVVFEDQVREGVVGCTDPASTEYNSGALIDNGTCCYEMPTISDSAVSNLKTKVDNEFDDNSGIENSLVIVTNATSTRKKITFTDGAFKGLAPLGGVVQVHADDLFTFPAGKTFADYEYTLELEGWHGAAQGGKVFWTHEQLHPSGTTNHQFNIRVGQASSSRHVLNATTPLTTNEVAGTKTFRAHHDHQRTGDGLFLTSGMNYKLTATHRGSNVDNDCDDTTTVVYVGVDIDDQTFTYGCKDTNAINHDPDALLTDNTICCYEMPTIADNITNNLQAKVNSAFSGSQIDASQITIINSGTAVRKIRFNDGAFEVPFPSGGVIGVDATDVFDFPAGKDYTDYEYTLDLLGWSGDSMGGQTSWTHVELHGDDGTVGNNQFNIRVGGSNGDGPLHSRHYLDSSGGQGDTWVQHCISGQNNTGGMTYRLTATDVSANDGCGNQIIVDVKVDVECQDFVTGCTDNTATNYNENAVVDDGSCIPVVEGCTDIMACNYDEGANTDDGSCLYRECCFSTTNLIAILDGWEYDGNTSYLLQPTPSVPILEGWDDTSTLNPWRFTDKFHASTTPPGAQGGYADGYHAGFGQYNPLGHDVWSRTCVKPSKRDENRAGGAYRGLIMSKFDLDGDQQLGTNSGAIYDLLNNTCGLMAVYDGFPTSGCQTSVPASNRVIQIGDEETGLWRAWGEVNGENGLKGTGTDWAAGNDGGFVSNQTQASDIGKSIFSCLLGLATDLNSSKVKDGATGLINCDHAEEIADYWAAHAFILGCKSVVPYNYHLFTNRISAQSWWYAVGFQADTWTLQNVKNWFRAAIWSSHKIGQGCGSCEDENMGNLVGVVLTGGPYDTGPFGDWEIVSDDDLQTFVENVGLHDNSFTVHESAGGEITNVYAAVATAATGSTAAAAVTETTNFLSGSGGQSYNFSWLGNDDD